MLYNNAINIYKGKKTAKNTLFLVTGVVAFRRSKTEGRKESDVRSHHVPRLFKVHFPWMCLAVTLHLIRTLEDENKNKELDSTSDLPQSEDGLGLSSDCFQRLTEQTRVFFSLKRYMRAGRVRRHECGRVRDAHTDM